ncbi:MAG: DUF1700 domain-containing protein [Anaerovoracaceae bacterium]
MSRAEWLKKLQLELYKLPRIEIDDAVAYYNEYFEEAGPEHEQDVIRDLGSPSKIATQIKADYAVRQLENNDYTGNAEGKKKGVFSKAWMIILAVFGGICAAPVALPVVIALVALAVAMIVAVVGILVAAIATAIGVFIGGLVMVVLGIILLGSSVPAGVLFIGLGLMGMALTAMFALGVGALTKLLFKAVANTLKKKRKEKAKIKYRRTEDESFAEAEAEPETETKAKAEAETDAAPATAAAKQKLSTNGETKELLLAEEPEVKETNGGEKNE